MGGRVGAGFFDFLNPNTNGVGAAFNAAKSVFTDPPTGGVVSGPPRPAPVNFYNAVVAAYVPPSAPRGPPPPEFTRQIVKTDTLVIFESPVLTSFMVGVRGTAEAADAATWHTIPLNTLGATNRVRADVDTLNAFFTTHPAAECWFAGHSLGGAVADELMAKFPTHSLGARSYNPAVQPKDAGNTNHVRIFNENDPLGRLGRFSTNAEVRRTGSPAGLLEAHKLQNIGAGLGTFSAAHLAAGMHGTGGGPRRLN